jgi:hypothetical protein
MADATQDRITRIVVTRLKVTSADEINPRASE